MEEIIFLVGRILFGGFFLMFGMMHFKNKKNMIEYAKSKGVSRPKMAVLGTGMLLMIGGLGIVFGTFIQIAMFLLLVFLIPTSFIMHKFWKETEPEKKMNQMVMFMHNMAHIGAILILFIMGGPWPLSIF